MTSSNRDVPSNSGVFEVLLQNALPHWRGGLALAGFVAFVLAVRWLHIASHIYESRLILEQAAAPPGAAPLDSEELERQLHDELTHPAKADAATVAPESVYLRRLPGGELVLLCRADDANTARENCRTASERLQHLGPLRVAAAATLPARPLPPAREALSVVISSTALIGLLCGAVWMLGGALLPRRALSAPRASNPAPPMHRISYAPTARVVMMTSAEEARKDGGGRASEGTSLSTQLVPSQPSDPGQVLPLPVPTNWVVDDDLRGLDSASDLAKLCDELYVAATQGCFVVGVTSEPGSAHRKSRLAAKLAWQLAQGEHARVLLLEVDFAQPKVADVMNFDVPPLSGFSQQLQAHIREGRQAPWVVVRCTGSLCVLAEGKMRTPGMIYSNEFTVALNQLRRHFDLIVADGPAIGSQVDTRAFDDVSDGIVFVTPNGTPSDHAFRTASQWFRAGRVLAAATV